MKTLFKTILGLLFLTPILTQAQTNCEDPIEIIPLALDGCDLTFDLCIDRYVLPNNTDAVILNVFANDSGDFVPCESEILDMGPNYPGKGDVDQMDANFTPECALIYYPNSSFTPPYADTFFYAFAFEDVCPTDPDYCDGTNGKIWNFWSRYEGSKTLDSIYVASKTGSSYSNFYKITDGPYNNGDYFFADGEPLGNGQSNWRFTFYYNDNTTEDVDVHTSCSAPIFGLTHPAEQQGQDWVSIGNVMTPISGCIAPQGDKGDCEVAAPNFAFMRDKINTREANQVSTQRVDTTMVIVTIPADFILPVEFGSITTVNLDNHIQVDWNLETVVNEDVMILEKSNDGIHFQEIMVYGDVESKAYRYLDDDVLASLHYYRVAVYDYNGGVAYSDVVLNRRFATASGDINVLPNPSNGQFTITAGIGQSGSGILLQDVSIFDLSGKLVLNKKPNSDVLTINQSESPLSKGVYIVRAMLNDGNTQAKRLIIH